MLYFVYDSDGRINSVTKDLKDAICQENAGNKVFCRNSFVSFQQAHEVAKDATNSNYTDDEYIAVENSGYPKFDVICAPKVGDMVSKAFNGDYYPEGRIKKVSKTFTKIETDTGVVFRRRKNSGTWVESGGGPFVMVFGHHDERNPHV